MKYFDIIARVIIMTMFGLGVLLTAFVIIRDNFFRKDNEDNCNQGTDSSGGYEDIW